MELILLVLVLAMSAAVVVVVSTVGAILTMRRRCALVTFTCSDGFWLRESLRRRRVKAMAAMMATSSKTAAI